MSGSTEHRKLERISMELNQLSLRRQQFNDRRNMLTILQEFRNRSNHNSTEGSKEQIEIQCIDQELQELSEKKRELQESQDNILHSKDQRKVSFAECIISQGACLFSLTPLLSLLKLHPVYQVILDIQKLPPCSSQTQCPECRQFITTEIVTSVGNVACLVCVTMSILGCVAGCCLIPFCIDNFKDVTHRCPKCRSSIITITKL